MTVSFASYIRNRRYFHMLMPQSVSMSACHVTPQDDVRLPIYMLFHGRVSRNMLYLVIGVSKCENTHGNCTFSAWRCQNGPQMQIPTSGTSWAPSESQLFQYNTWSRLQKHAQSTAKHSVYASNDMRMSWYFPYFCHSLYVTHFMSLTLCHFMSLLSRTHHHLGSAENTSDARNGSSGRFWPARSAMHTMTHINTFCSFFTLSLAFTIFDYDMTVSLRLTSESYDTLTCWCLRAWVCRRVM